MISVTGSKPPSADDIARMVAASATATVRSPVYVWLRRNHAVLSAEFAEARVNWSQVAIKLAEIGVTDAKGQKPRAEAVRRAWWQVRRDLAAAKAKRQAGKAPEPVAVPYPDPVRLIRAPEQDDMPDAHQDDDPLPARRSDPPQEKITLKPSRFRSTVAKGE